MLNHDLIEVDDARAMGAAAEELLAITQRARDLLREGRSAEAEALILFAGTDRPEEGLLADGQLATAYAALGAHVRALAVYRRLVEAHPEQPTLRLNLALCHLRLGQTGEAQRALDELLRRHPGHRKAKAYLGLVHRKLGDLERAHRLLTQAGATHLADRLATGVELERVFDAERTAPDEPLPAGVERDILDFARATGVDDFVVPAPRTIGLSGAGLSEPTPIEELVRRTRVSESLTGRFLVTNEGYFLADVHGRISARLDGLHFCSSEGLVYKPLLRRARGGDQSDPFGVRDRVLNEITGHGRLGFHPRDGVFTPLALGGQAAYVREELVFAFDDQVLFENGRLPGSSDPLVQLRGAGAVVLHTPSTLRSLDVTPDRGLVLPAGGLVGWIGRLLPRVTSGGPFDPAFKLLEFSGEGVVLFCLR